MNIVIAIIILLVYTLAMIKIGGSIPPSLSASVFNLPTNKRWIWTVIIFVVCILVVPTYIEKTNINTQFLSFPSIGGLGFVGAAPLVKNYFSKSSITATNKKVISDNINNSGITTDRPVGSSIYVGFMYQDTTLGKPIFVNAISGDTVT